MPGRSLLSNINRIGRQRGRPSAYSDDIAETICERIANGVSLVRILKDDGMPGYSTVTQWLQERSDFAAKYARAREMQAEWYADSITELAAEAEGLDGAGVAAKRLQVDARKWVASKLLPKKYGDRIDVSGGITVTHDLSLRLADAIARLNRSAGDEAIIEHDPDPDACTARH
jgi:hypothetical protein